MTLVFFVIFFSTYQGVRDASRVLIDNLPMLGATERQLVRHVLVPSALTWIFASLHTSLGFAMVGAVVGEYLGSTRGLGYLNHWAPGDPDAPTAMAVTKTVIARLRMSRRHLALLFCHLCLDSLVAPRRCLRPACNAASGWRDIDLAV